LSELQLYRRCSSDCGPPDPPCEPSGAQLANFPRRCALSCANDISTLPGWQVKKACKPVEYGLAAFIFEAGTRFHHEAAIADPRPHPDPRSTAASQRIVLLPRTHYSTRSTFASGGSLTSGRRGARCTSATCQTASRRAWSFQSRKYDKVLPFADFEKFHAAHCVLDGHSCVARFREMTVIGQSLRGCSF
jgi:hypothetical protein